MNDLSAFYSMASTIVLVSMLFFVLLWACLFIANRFAKRRYHFKAILILYLLYMAWWLLDCFVFYSCGIVSLGHRAYVFYLFNPPCDACNPLVNIEIVSDKSDYGCSFNYKYSGNYRIGIGDIETGSVNLSGPTVSVRAEFSDVTGKILQTVDIVPKRNSISGKFDSSLSTEINTFDWPQHVLPLRLSVNIKGDIGTLLEKNTKLAIFMRRFSVY